MIRLHRNSRAIRRPSACVSIAPDGTRTIIEGSETLKRKVGSPNALSDAPETTGKLVATATMFYVVTKGFADTMNGERSSTSRKGSIYAAFADPFKAREFIETRGLRMVAKVVAQ